MNDSCPVLTPAQRQYLEIQNRAEKKMLAALFAALDNAAREAAEELKATDATDPPPARDYFAAVAHQKLFLLLCGADLETMKGGDPQLAAHLLRNGRNIADHYFTGKISEPV